MGLGVKWIGSELWQPLAVVVVVICAHMLLSNVSSESDGDAFKSSTVRRRFSCRLIYWVPVCDMQIMPIVITSPPTRISGLVRLGQIYYLTRFV